MIEPIGQVTTGSVVVVCGADGSNFGAVTACLNIAKGREFYIYLIKLKTILF